MSTTTIKQNNNPVPNRIHPKVFLLWVGMGTVVMLFAGFTSAYIVRRLQGNWEEYQMPSIFWASTGVILLSGITMFICSRAFKQENYARYRTFLGATLLLGLLFCGLQYAGWMQLKSIGIDLSDTTPSGAFLYVISGIHAAHVLGGILFLFIFWVRSLRRPDPFKALMQDISPDRNLGIQLLATYWHFVDILWIYLFFFFLYYQ